MREALNRCAFISGGIESERSLVLNYMALPIILQIVSTMSIFAGVVFAVLQLRYSNRQRARESALQMLHSFRTPEFLTATDIVLNLPEGLSKKEIERRLGDKIVSILVLFGTFEGLGILVHNRDIDIAMVEDFFSGILIFSGRKLKNYLEETRRDSGRQTYYEWYQWLYEQVEKRESKSPAVPAYTAFRDWEE